MPFVKMKEKVNLDDKDGITHVYNEKFNDILTYNKSEKLCVAVKNASECCLIEKVDNKEKYKFCIYDTNTKNKKCEFEYEIKFEYEIEDNEEVINCEYSKNNKSLIVVTFDDKLKNIYDKNLNLIFENIGYIDYLELLGKKLMSKNKKTVIVDGDYNVIKTLDEDYREFEVFEYNNKHILKGTYAIMRSETVGES